MTLAHIFMSSFGCAPRSVVGGSKGMPLLACIYTSSFSKGLKQLAGFKHEYGQIPLCTEFSLAAERIGCNDLGRSRNLVLW
jgi:hypothetical protein